MDWLSAAQALPLDGQLRIEHCGTGKAATVRHGDAGWSLYCHRCGDNLFERRPTESLSERLARIATRQATERAVTATIVPPAPMDTLVSSWPLAARVWLYKAGFSNQDISDLSIYYHKETDRVVIPMIDGGELVYWQARAYDWTPKSHRPKYLNPTRAPSNAGVLFDRPGPVVLTEDYLSAYRVYDAGYAALTLLGTKLSPKLLARLMKRNSRIMTWLDNDTGRAGGSNPGQEAAATINKELRRLGLEVVNVLTDEDPKLYSRNQIAEILKGCQ